MSGEIKPSSDAAAVVYGARESSVRPKTNGESAATAGRRDSAGADTVKLTDRAQQLLRLEELIAEIPVVDSKRVDAVRQSIADGDYQIDAQLIADRMLQLDADQKKAGS